MMIGMLITAGLCCGLVVPGVLYAFLLAWDFVVKRIRR